ncbi:hypothetical protein B5F40_06950 [Gordonibacter sp. An230]|uniref:hypothetical protein n=1 Tax=Gordonibacter sp. An230 TaxID=1965592 RepID=UPI000B3A664D|nr:hypothetical protein [Gordonibacter sp. An230]OUO90444.1 hypothetical protein B5F40_06950 [Gordonibacter sp. An230]
MTAEERYDAAFNEFMDAVESSTLDEKQRSEYKELMRRVSLYSDTFDHLFENIEKVKRYAKCAPETLPSMLVLSGRIAELNEIRQ